MQIFSRFSYCNFRVGVFFLNHFTLCLKKVPTCKLSVTLSNLNRFSKILHCWKAYDICYKTHTTSPTSSWMCLDDRLIRAAPAAKFEFIIYQNIVATCSRYKNLDRFFFGFVTMHAFDRQTDRRTDRILIVRPIQCSAVKINAILLHIKINWLKLVHMCRYKLAANWQSFTEIYLSWVKILEKV